MPRLRLFVPPSVLAAVALAPAPALGRPPVVLSFLAGLLDSVLWYLFHTPWGWILLAILVARSVERPLATWRRRQRFFAARRFELQNPRDADARFQMGLIHFQGRQYRRALPWFTEAVRIAETHGASVDPKLYQYLGHTLLRRGRPAQAIAAYEAGLEAAPRSGHGESEAGIAEAHRRLGRPEEARRWNEQAAEANRSLIGPRLRLAAQAHRAGDAAAAQSWIAEARRIELPGFLARQQRRPRLARALWPLSRPFL